MKNTKKAPKGEQSFVLTSTKHTKVNFKEVDKKIIDVIVAGKDFWITTTSQIQIKQENEPVPVNDGIDISVSLLNPAEIKKENKPKKKK